MTMMLKAVDVRAPEGKQRLLQHMWSSSRGAGWVNVAALLLLLDAHLIEDRFPLLLLAMDVPRQLLRRHRTREAT
jgi:hypothetical protein